MLKWKFFQYKWVAITWLLIISILFFLPGSALPKENWLNRIYFDKLVHIGFFGLLLFLWRSSFNWNYGGYHWRLLSLALLYGFFVEFIQLWFVPNRSFDLYDVAADMTGAIIGLSVWQRVYIKK
ncbi:MAG TPA: VanZ family protein [Flavisolibacter sp.]|nr:VanZ family protein [Flavisolibacter sp.]